LFEIEDTDDVRLRELLFSSFASFAIIKDSSFNFVFLYGPLFRFGGDGEFSAVFDLFFLVPSFFVSLSNKSIKSILLLLLIILNVFFSSRLSQVLNARGVFISIFDSSSSLLDSSLPHDEHSL
jgi:hypothetical protein